MLISIETSQEIPTFVSKLKIPKGIKKYLSIDTKKSQDTKKSYSIDTKISDTLSLNQ